MLKLCGNTVRLHLSPSQLTSCRSRSVSQERLGNFFLLMRVATVVVVGIQFSREGGCPVLLTLSVVALHRVADLVLLFVEDWNLSLSGSLEASHTVVLLSALVALIAVVAFVGLLLSLPLEARLPVRLGLFLGGHTDIRSTLVRTLLAALSFGSIDE